MGVLEENHQNVAELSIQQGIDSGSERSDLFTAAYWQRLALVGTFVLNNLANTILPVFGSIVAEKAPVVMPEVNSIVAMAGERALSPLMENIHIVQDSFVPDTVELKADNTYTVVPVGDSLMAGWGGTDEKVNGQKIPRSCLQPYVDMLNRQKPGIAHYAYDIKLVKVYMSLAESTQRIDQNTQKLANIPNLILFVSGEYHTIGIAGEHIQQDSSTGLWGKIVRDAWIAPITALESLEEYNNDMQTFQDTIAHLQQERNQRLGSKSAMTVIFLGLPNATAVPHLKRQIAAQEKVIPPAAFIYVIEGLYNLKSRLAMRKAELESGYLGTHYVYVSTFDQSVNPRTDINEIKPYTDHPTDRGYDKIARAVADQTKILYEDAARIVSNSGQ